MVETMVAIFFRVQNRDLTIFKDLNITTIDSWIGNYKSFIYLDYGIDTNKYEILSISLINYNELGSLLGTLIGTAAFYIVTSDPTKFPKNILVRIAMKRKTK